MEKKFLDTRFLGFGADPLNRLLSLCISTIKRFFFFTEKKIFLFEEYSKESGLILVDSLIDFCLFVFAKFEIGRFFWRKSWFNGDAHTKRTFLRDNTVSLRAIQLVRDNAIRARGSVVPFVFLFSLSLSPLSLRSSTRKRKFGEPGRESSFCATRKERFDSIQLLRSETWKAGFLFPIHRLNLVPRNT